MLVMLKYCMTTKWRYYAQDLLAIIQSSKANNWVYHWMSGTQCICYALQVCIVLEIFMVF